MINRQHAIITLATVGLCLGSGYSYLKHQRNLSPQQTESGLFNVDGADVQGIRLVNQAGNNVKWADFSKTRRLVSFGYTYCPDVCPTTLLEMANVTDALSKRGIAITPLFVTVDPARDTPKTLKEYVGYFHSALVGLSTSQQELKSLATTFKVHYGRSDKSNSNPDYLMNHSAGLFFVDEDGEVREIFDGTATTDDIANAIYGHVS